MLPNRILTFLALWGLFATTSPAQAQSEPSSRLYDLEIDPVAYVLDGYSVHVGMGSSRLRVDLGAYALAVPQFVHGNDDFDASFDGFGVKLQYFPFGGQKRGWIGLDGAAVRTLVERRGTDLADRQRNYNAGLDAGWHFDLGPDFYANPWIGIGYLFGTRDVTLGGSSYEPKRLTVFPTVHVGYRLR